MLNVWSTLQTMVIWCIHNVPIFFNTHPFDKECPQQQQTEWYSMGIIHLWTLLWGFHLPEPQNSISKQTLNDMNTHIQSTQNCCQQFLRTVQKKYPKLFQRHIDMVMWVCWSVPCFDPIFTQAVITWMSADVKVHPYMQTHLQTCFHSKWATSHDSSFTFLGYCSPHILLSHLRQKYKERPSQNTQEPTLADIAYLYSLTCHHINKNTTPPMGPH